MNLFPRWLRPEAGPREDETAEVDPGDMGTAFGLDATLAPHDDTPASETAAADAATWQLRLDRRPRR
jgi:hypothetical protein